MLAIATPAFNQMAKTLSLFLLVLITEVVQAQPAFPLKASPDGRYLVDAAGRPFFSPAITQMLLDDYMRRLQQTGSQDSYDLLTEREKELLYLLAQGKTNKEAATIMNVSVSTVETHRTNFMQKLNLHNTAEIVLYAVRKRLIS